MAKRKADKVEAAAPDDPVRFVAKMTREQRARFRYFCDMRGLDMEQVGASWIMERLAVEEGANAAPRKSK